MSKRIRDLEARGGQFARLFAADVPDGGPDLCYNNMFAESEGYGLEDVPTLLDIACEASLDDADQGQAAPLHAIHALIRLGAPALIPSMPRLVARVLELRPDSGDYVTELLGRALSVALVAGGAAALPHVGSSLIMAVQSLEHWRKPDTWLGIGILVRVLVALPFSIAEVGAGDYAANSLLEAIEATYRLWKDGAKPPRSIWRNLSTGLESMVDHAQHLGPFLRARHATRALALMRAIKLDRGERSGVVPSPGNVSFTRFMCSMGIEPVPGDPAVVHKSAPTAQDVQLTWTARHGKQAPPVGTIFPGAEGYVAPPLTGNSPEGGWVVDPWCINVSCGMNLPQILNMDCDDETRARTLIERLQHGLTRERKPIKPEDLLTCAACRITVFCSPSCQKECWAPKKGARSGITGGTMLPLHLVVDDILTYHKVPCALYAKFFAEYKAAAGAAIKLGE